MPLARQRTRTNRCGPRATDSTDRGLGRAAPTTTRGQIIPQPQADGVATWEALRRRPVQPRWTQDRAEQKRSRNCRDEMNRGALSRGLEILDKLLRRGD